MTNGPFVWYPDAPQQRLTHVYFRREFVLDAETERAELCLFAQTHYHLRVNGTLLGSGPARSHPDHPEYDRYDLRPHLRRGANVVAVQVAHEGRTTFHHLLRPGALVAWGCVETSGTVVPFSTTEGWRCHLSRAHDPEAPDYSFAIGAIQILDERLVPAGWDLPGAPEGEWVPPVPVARRADWGALRPRSIPPLEEQEKTARLLLSMHGHEEDEQVVSFRRYQVLRGDSDTAPRGYMFACTYIHSPRRQDVQVGTWWGEYFLNGVEVGKAPGSDSASYRTPRVFALQEGPNLLLLSYLIVKGLWDFHLAVPRAAGLRFSTNGLTPESGEGRECGAAFRVTPALTVAEAEPVLKRLPVAGLEAVPELAHLWEDVPSSPLPASPCRAMLWRRWVPPAEPPAAATDAVARIPAEEGRSLSFDLGQMSLGRVFVEFDAPEGTVLETGYAEALRDGKPDIGKHQLMQSAERFITRGGLSRLETFAPRGLRYLRLDVTGHTADVHIRRVGVVSTRYPLARVGEFECSDAFFNELWTSGWETLRLCAEDVYTDTPWRERTLYGGDLLVETATTLAGAHDTRLIRRSLEVFLQCADPKTGTLGRRAPSGTQHALRHDFALLELICTAWYCRREQDLEFARRCRPLFQLLMDGLRSDRAEDGLVRGSRQVFMDHGYAHRDGCLCLVNALAAGTFDAWGDLLALLGETQEAERARELGRELGARTVEAFWDATAGAFADTLPHGGGDEAHTVHAAAWLLLFCNLPEERRAAAVARVARQLPLFLPEREPSFISAYNAFYLLGGLYRAGAAGQAEASMRTIYHDMLAHPTGTVWEHANPAKSLSHAWASAPTFYLSTQVLGVQLGFPVPDGAPLEDPFTTLVIAPQSETLQWARGVVPHPLGTVRVAWDVRGDVLFLRYHAPQTVGVVVRPRGRLARLRLEVQADASPTP